MVIKCALGRLKGRFGVLKCEMDINLKELLHVINQCFILHNYCKVNGDHISNEAIEKASLLFKDHTELAPFDSYTVYCFKTLKLLLPLPLMFSDGFLFISVLFTLSMFLF